MSQVNRHWEKRAQQAEADNAQLRKQIKNTEFFRQNQSDDYAELKKKYITAKADTARLRTQLEQTEEERDEWKTSYRSLAKEYGRG